VVLFFFLQLLFPALGTAAERFSPMIRFWDWNVPSSLFFFFCSPVFLPSSLQKPRVTCMKNCYYIARSFPPRTQKRRPPFFFLLLPTLHGQPSRLYPIRGIPFYHYVDLHSLPIPLLFSFPPFFPYFKTLRNLRDKLETKKVFPLSFPLGRPSSW